MGDQARAALTMPASTTRRSGDASVVPRVLIVGAGLMGRWHCRVAQKLGGRVIGIVDPDANAALGLARKALGAKPTETISAALATSVPDIAHICTPTAAHFEAALALVEAGVHVLVEKPLCQTAQQAEALADAASRHGAIVCPVHQYAFQRGVVQAEAWLPGLGSVRRIHFDIRSAGADHMAPSERGEVVREILPHPISILQRLLPHASLAELDWSLSQTPDGEYSAHAAAGDAAISISISMNARPTCFRTHIYADKGAVDIDGFHGFATLARGGGASRAAKVLAPFAESMSTLAAASENLVRRAIVGEAAYPGLADLAEAFYRAASSSGSLPPPIPPREILAGMRTWERLAGVRAP